MQQLIGSILSANSGSTIRTKKYVALLATPISPFSGFRELLLCENGVELLTILVEKGDGFRSLTILLVVNSYLEFSEILSAHNRSFKLSLNISYPFITGFLVVKTV